MALAICVAVSHGVLVAGCRAMVQAREIIAGHDEPRGVLPRPSKAVRGDIPMKFACVVLAVVSLAMAGGARAADPFYLGSWTFSTAVVAPWADAQRKPDSAEQARLMGKTIVFKAKEISGPRPFACAKPQYKVTDYAADMIFQGAFDEMQRSSKKADPKALAASLGLAGPKI